jgi:hypothetical protein
VCLREDKIAGGSVETWGSQKSELRPTSSNPSRSHREFHEKDRTKAYSSFEASLKRVRSSPSTMTTSGQAFFASEMSCSLYKPCASQRADRLRRRQSPRAQSSTRGRGQAYSSPSLVVARDDYLLLLHSQRTRSQRRGFSLDYAGVESIVILRSSVSMCRFECQ